MIVDGLGNPAHSQPLGERPVAPKRYIVEEFPEVERVVSQTEEAERQREADAVVVEFGGDESKRDSKRDHDEGSDRGPEGLVEGKRALGEPEEGSVIDIFV